MDDDNAEFRHYHLYYTNKRRKEMIPPYKRKVLNKVYHLYLDSVCVETIGCLFRLTNEEVNEIIDYLNEIYV